MRFAGQKIFARGAHASVRPSEIEGYVLKEMGSPPPPVIIPPANESPMAAFQRRARGEVIPGTGTAGVDALAEVDAMEISRGLHMAPEVRSVEIRPDGSAAIEMKDLRDNYLVEADVNESKGIKSYLREAQTGLAVSKQLGALNLRGIHLQDRHSGNVMIHKMTGRPMQIDFGGGAGEHKVLQTLRDKVLALTTNTAMGFKYAGLDDIAEIYLDTVTDLVRHNDSAPFGDEEMLTAWDIAKQGFSLLQKIDKPVREVSPVDSLARNRMAAKMKLDFDYHQ